MSKQKKHLAFYEKCMTNETMPNDGICNNIAPYGLKNELFELFHPLPGDKEGNTSGVYWGYGIPYSINFNDASRVPYEFTPLRQTIVLFMAAMNNEL